MWNKVKIFLLIVVLLSVVLLGGCSTGIYKSLDRESFSFRYLSKYNATDCNLVRMDHKKLESYKYNPKFRNFTTITANVDEVLEVYYAKQSIGYINDDGGVSIRYNIYDEGGKLIHSEEDVTIIFGSEYFDKEINDLLKESSPDLERTVLIGDKISSLLQIPGAYKMVFSVNSFINYIPYENTQKWLSDNNYSSFNEFYSSILTKKIDEWTFEQNEYDKNSFMNLLVDCAVCDISEDAVINYAIHIVEEYYGLAESFSIDIVKFCNDYLKMDYETDFYAMCLEESEKEIKSILALDKAAEDYKINYLDAFTEFCTINKISESDEMLINEAELYCLKAAVFEFFSKMNSLS